ncbi:duf1649 domain protein [Lentinula edodes]|uniref:Autophagy-related protein 101 n=1 Tax=Lentinula edodes TaxID=5353 RepID=A0A1Q3EIP2_LENED|nr:duf1649 domain protein [Lentinula edodes]
MRNEHISYYHHRLDPRSSHHQRCSSRHTRCHSFSPLIWNSEANDEGGVRCDYDAEMGQLVEEKVELFWKGIEEGMSKRGQIIITFSEKRPKKSWFQVYVGEEDVPWEQWIINAEIQQPRDRDYFIHLYYIIQFQTGSNPLVPTPPEVKSMKCVYGYRIVCMTGVDKCRCILKFDTRGTYGVLLSLFLLVLTRVLTGEKSLQRHLTDKNVGPCVALTGDPLLIIFQYI